jgi:acyl-CoA synthetase (AMP-forming)/AMP-acid ligase II
VLLRHPAVLNVAVLGLPDADLGERVAAVVQLAADAEVTEQELGEFAAASLARFELPAQWWLRTEPLPMHDSGKTNKTQLKTDWPN